MRRPGEPLPGGGVFEEQGGVESAMRENRCIIRVDWVFEQACLSVRPSVHPSQIPTATKIVFGTGTSARAANGAMRKVGALKMEAVASVSRGIDLLNLGFQDN